MIDKEKVKKAVFDILEAVGEDPTREGLIETPLRVANMFSEIFSGYDQNNKDCIKLFDEPGSSAQIITVKDIQFHSMCEHHLMPFFGKIDIAYIPKNDKILGLSKFSRIVNSFSKKLQVQERLTSEIAEFLYDNVQPEGVLVVAKASHLCTTMRGVKSLNSKTKTMCALGAFKENNDLLIKALTLLK